MSMSTKDTKSTRSVRRKVIFVFLSCAVSLVLAWVISRVAFTEIMDTVEKITTPEPKLDIVSGISRDIMRLDQLQRAQAFGGNKAYNSFSNESAAIISSLDSLKSLYDGSEVQQLRIDSIKTLLQQRDRLFNAYVKVREKVVDSEEFSEQLQSLSAIIYEPNTESKVVTTERKRRTTTIAGDTSAVVMPEVEEAQDDRGFFSRLFGRKQPTAQQPQQVVEERRMVEEEMETIIDTIRATQPDSLLARIDSAMQRFQLLHQQQREQFVDREMELTVASNALFSNMLSILHSVENEAMQQMEVDNQQAKAVVSQSVWRIGGIILVFFCITAIMVYLILADIRRSNAYRMALEAAKEEAEYHAAAKQRFLANMSHELRTPLQSIIGYSEQLKQEQPASDTKVDAIYQSSEHLLQIVNEILDYSRITSGRITLNEKPFAVKGLISSVVAVMKTQAQTKGIELVLNMRILGSGQVLGDAFRIKQILFNLLSNAVKFTDRGAVTLNISTVVYTEKTELNIVVKDTGKGIPKGDLERIFDDFEQSESANSGIHFGSGLGLSIVKTICESMGGQIHVESRKGIGSTFRVNLPLKTAAEPLPDVPREPVENASTSAAGNVWIVDDDKLILALCQTILDKYGVTYRCFQSPKAVLDAPWDPSVKTILMDIRMPEMDGTQLNHALRQKTDSKDVNIYACTAQVLPEEQEEILSEGFDGLLLKPFKEADLLRLLGISPRSTTAPPNRAHVSAIQHMALGDEEQVHNIINHYVRDTASDIADLKAHHSRGSLAEVELLLHRIAGRTAQVGGEKIAFRLRKMEIDARSGELPQKTELEASIEAVEMFSQQLQIHLPSPAIAT